MASIAKKEKLTLGRPLTPDPATDENTSVVDASEAATERAHALLKKVERPLNIFRRSLTQGASTATGKDRRILRAGGMTRGLRPA
jgi:hypothetical protein